MLRKNSETEFEVRNQVNYCSLELEKLHFFVSCSSLYFMFASYKFKNKTLQTLFETKQLNYDNNTHHKIPKTRTLSIFTKYEAVKC